MSIIKKAAVIIKQEGGRIEMRSLYTVEVDGISASGSAILIPQVVVGPLSQGKAKRLADGIKKRTSQFFVAVRVRKLVKPPITVNEVLKHVDKSFLPE